MQYRTVPKTQDKLSVLGYGSMRLPSRSGLIRERETREQLLYAVSEGVNYIDTGFPYHGGAAEPTIGRILAQAGCRNQVYLATKLPPWSVRGSADMEHILNEQLRRFRTDRIDYYLVHGIASRAEWDRLLDLGVLTFLDRIQRDGRVRRVGFSFHGDKRLFREVVDAYDWAMCQIQYNYLDIDNQAGNEGLAYAHAKNLAVMVMEPLRGGNLTKHVPPEVQAVWDKAPIKRTPAEWALRWLYDQPEVTLVLSGMNRMDHIRENIRIANEGTVHSLTDAEKTLITEARAAYRSVFQIGCTGCRYCMPCPAGVDIPNCFELYNNLTAFGLRSAKFDYATRVGGILGHTGLASLCVDCGACEKVCPQHLPIRQALKTVAKEMEGPMLKILAPAGRFFLRQQSRTARRKDVRG
jgi:predicted aldo/keto reductase-like oxidoreductase